MIKIKILATFIICSKHKVIYHILDNAVILFFCYN